MCLLARPENCVLNGSIVLLLLLVMAQIQKEHLWIAVIDYCRSCRSQIRSEHKGSRDLTCCSIVGLFLPAQFSSCDSGSWGFILCFILLLLLLCHGSADRRCLQRLWSKWVFFFLSIFLHTTGCRTWGQHLVLIAQSDISSLFLCRFLCWNCAERFCSVQGQQHRLHKCLLSPKYRWIVVFFFFFFKCDQLCISDCCRRISNLNFLLLNFMFICFPTPQLAQFFHHTVTHFSIFRCAYNNDVYLTQS